MVQQKASSFIKTTVNTRWHIDYSWWDQHTDEDLRTYLLSHLSQEQRESLGDLSGNHLIDLVDPETGEVTQANDLQFALQRAAQQPGFISPHTSLVDGIFRALIANGNRPLSANDLSPILSRQAPVILKTLSGTRVYKGIRPTE